MGIIKRERERERERDVNITIGERDLKRKKRKSKMYYIERNIVFTMNNFSTGDCETIRQNNN